MNTETMNMKKINDVHAIVEIGEDNTTALIVDPRTTIRTTFEQRNTAEQAKLATMIWNIGVESILNVCKPINAPYASRSGSDNHLFG